MVAALVSAVHLLSLGIGLGSIFVRARALGAVDRGEDAVARVLSADNVWGIAAATWIGSGLGRLFGELDKGLDFYVYNGMFWVKMSLFGLVFALEVWPMVTFIRWRLSKGPPDTARAGLFATTSYVQVAVVTLMVPTAAMMARGLWLVGG